VCRDHETETERSDFATMCGERLRRPHFECFRVLDNERLVLAEWTKLGRGARISVALRPTENAIWSRDRIEVGAYVIKAFVLTTRSAPRCAGNIEANEQHPGPPTLNTIKGAANYPIRQSRWARIDRREAPRVLAPARQRVSNPWHLSPTRSTSSQLDGQIQMTDRPGAAEIKSLRRR
jgi:hypothetical protein